MASVTALHPSLHQTPSVPVNQENHTSLPTLRGDNVPRGPVSATLNFFQLPEDGTKPFNYVEKAPEGEPQRNFGDHNQTVEIKDVRGHESEYSLEKDAFATLKGYPHNPEIDWDDEESIKRVYYPEVERILKDATGGHRVILFDHTIRRANPNAHRAPVQRAHIDQTPYSAALRVDVHAPEEAEELKKGRYRIINVWRPINGTVESHPLTFASATSVGPNDIVPVEHRYPHRTGETAGVLHNPNLKWHYWSGIDNDERILLQCSDSFNEEVRVPHSAFKDPRNNETHKPRESIEVRALVFG